VQGERYRSLDAMRGIAAILVVLYHAEALFHLGGWSPPLAFLAVDLFFCLSGFVLAKSYDGRLAAGLSPLAFMRLRVRRLFPLYLLGWASALVAAAATGALQPTAVTVATGVLNGLMLPGVDRMFPTNPPAWSLFFELWVANLLFAAAWRLLHGWKLGVCVAAGLLCYLVAQRHFHDMNIGFEWSSAWGGFARVLFSFFAGVGVARFHGRHPGRVRLPAIVLLAILVGVLSFSLSGQLRQIQQILCVVLIFPLLIYLGADATERRPKLGAVLGDASYAMYVLHWPALVAATWLLGSAGFTTTGLAVQLSLTAAILLAALMIHHRYDTPARHHLAVRSTRRNTAG